MKKSDGACRAIRAATSESQVMAAVRSYLDSLDVSQLAMVPAGFTAVGLGHAEEALHTALDLVHQHILGGASSADTAALNDITLVFSTAAKRLAALAKNMT